MGGKGTEQGDTQRQPCEMISHSFIPLSPSLCVALSHLSLSSLSHLSLFFSLFSSPFSCLPSPHITRHTYCSWKLSLHQKNNLPTTHQQPINTRNNPFNNVLFVDLLQNVGSHHCMEIRFHEIENQINVAVVFCLEVLGETDDVVVAL